MNVPSSGLTHRLILFVVCLVAIPSLLTAPALAQDAEGAADAKDTNAAEDKEESKGGYLEYSAGLSVLPNQSLKGSDATSAGYSGSARSDAGYSFGAAFGWHVYEFLGADFRTELAVNFRSSEVNTLNFGGPDITPQIASDASGDLSLLSVMANGYVDYDFGLGVVPYVGIGVGYGRLRMDAETKGSTFKVNDTTSVFAWNVMIGGVLPYSETVDFTGGYRYLSTEDSELDSVVGGIGPRRLDFEYDVHEITLGLRVKF
jgi:OmpA-OmpF porin, OOP family